MGRTGPVAGFRSSAVFLFLIIIGGLFLVATPARAAGATLSLHMVGESPMFDAGVPVLIAGVWHQVTVNLSVPLTAPLVLRAVLPGSGSPSMSNTYQWVRNAGNDSWHDALYGMFLRPDLSSDDGQHVVFGVGVDGQASTGVWSFTASAGNATLVSQSVEVQAPQVSYGISAADFQFRLDPFTFADFTSQTNGQYLRLIDQGNVPLRLAVSFDVLQSQLSLANPSTVTHPGLDSVYYVRLTADPMPPQVVGVNGLATVTVLYVIPSQGATLLVPTFQQPFGLTVQVGRSGYSLKQVGGVAFQTIDSVTAQYGGVATWQVYLTGSQQVSLDISAAGARLVGIFTNGSALLLPATLTPSASRELAITIQITPTDPAGATVTFRLKLLGTGDSPTYTTAVRVTGGPASGGSGDISILWMLGSLAAALVFGTISFSQLRHRGGRSRKSRAAVEEKPVKRGYNARRRRRARRWRKPSNANGAKGSNGKRGKAESKGWPSVRRS